MKATRRLHRILLISLACAAVLVPACGDDDPTRPASGATVKGTLDLPAPAPGRLYAVLIDTDTDGAQQVAYTQGNCCDGTAIPYSISGIAEGTYYVYAIVRLVSDHESPPEDGDLYAIYGGSLDDMPRAPNVTVPASGTVTVNLTMDIFHDGP